jgi:prophage tail gpP-like protein
MDSFVTRANIERFRQQLITARDAITTATLQRLLQSELAKIRAEKPKAGSRH